MEFVKKQKGKKKDECNKRGTKKNGKAKAKAKKKHF